jgi:hypothetical protein
MDIQCARKHALSQARPPNPIRCFVQMGWCCAAAEIEAHRIIIETNECRPTHNKCHALTNSTNITLCLSGASVFAFMASPLLKIEVAGGVDCG